MGYSIAVANVNAIHDANDALIGIPVEHWKGVFRPIILGWIPAVLFSDQWNIVIALTVYNLAVFWIAFDLLFNYHYGNDLTYIGNTAFLDKLARRLGDTRIESFRLYLILKFLILVFSIIYVLAFYEV